ncbi:hypothetical protein C8Q73DRAFT_794177 [Cubamyces lactineus]|nr:hypothetical protein C8Q73DRAFT_794177 [Cubamyces lactineus]
MTRKRAARDAKEDGLLLQSGSIVTADGGGDSFICSADHAAVNLTGEPMLWHPSNSTAHLNLLFPLSRLLPPLAGSIASIGLTANGMSRGFTLQPLELLPEWLTESPITADDLRCTTPASTIFRMSFGGSNRLRHRGSTVSIASTASASTATASASASGSESDEEESDGGSFLWDSEESDDDSDTIEEPSPSPEPSRPAAVPPKPSPEPNPLPTHAPPSATPSHSRTPSTNSPDSPDSLGPTSAPPAHYDTRSPWYLHFDLGCLAALDDQLLQSPLDAFADLCYAHAVQSRAASPSARATAVPGGYSWRRLSRLLSACPDLGRAGLDFASGASACADGDTAPAAMVTGLGTATGTVPRRAAEYKGGRFRESESESDDSDSEGLASPEQTAPVPGWACGVYQPGVERQQAESPYRPYYRFLLDLNLNLNQNLVRPVTVTVILRAHASPVLYHLPGPESNIANAPFFPLLPDRHTQASQTLISKPLPALPSRTSCSPSPPLLPAIPLSPSLSPPPPPRLTCSPPPLYMPPPAVSQAQLALLFTNAPPRPGESVHFFPKQLQGQQQHQGQQQKQQRQDSGQRVAQQGKTRRGTLRVATATAHGHRQRQGAGSESFSGGGERAPWSPNANASQGQGARPNLFQRGLAGIGIRAGLSH